jgi:hypothetical protein
MRADWRRLLLLRRCLVRGCPRPWLLLPVQAPLLLSVCLLVGLLRRRIP